MTTMLEETTYDKRGFAVRDLSFLAAKSAHVLDKEVTTAKDALKMSGLDWEVELRPVYVKKGRTFEELPGRFSVTRMSDEKSLGNVGNVFVPLQNVEAFAFIDTLVGEGEAKYIAAGELKGGREVYIVVQLPSPDVLKDDPHDMYLIIRNGHYGGRALTELITPVRLACFNMMSMAIKSAKVKFAIRHTSTMHERIEVAHDSLKLAGEYVVGYADVARKLAASKIGDKAFRTVLDTVLPDRPRVEDVKQDILTVRASSPALEAHRTDRWGALNAVTEYMEHGRTSRGAEGRFLDVADGFARRVRNATCDALLAGVR